MSLRTPLRASGVQSRLPNHRFTRDLRVLGVVPSTSTLLSDLAARGTEDGVVIVAEAQTHGRGRRGAGWFCPSGRGLLFSVLVRPVPPGERRLLLPAAVGLAVVRALEALALPAAMKWPNDVLVDGEKVAGILIETADDYAVVGIGINANLERGDLPHDAPVPAGSLALLAGHPIDREQLLADVLVHLDRFLVAAAEGPPEDLARAFKERDALRGRRVTVREGDRVITGVVRATDPREGLILDEDGGGEVRVRAEHAHVLRIHEA